MLRKKLKREKLFEEMTDCLWIGAKISEEDKVSLEEETLNTEVETDEVKDSLMNYAKLSTRCVACLEEVKQKPSCIDDNQQYN